MRDFTEEEEAVLCRLVPTAHQLAQQSETAALHDWVQTLNGTECALLLGWAVRQNKAARQSAPPRERYVGQH